MIERGRTRNNQEKPGILHFEKACVDIEIDAVFFCIPQSIRVVKESLVRTL